jgi:ADP-ribose pyrophosphatase YjhB (NUDIX family)
MKFVIHISTLITNEENQFLLVKEKKEQVFNKLNLPGGHLEPGEGLVEGAKREAMEEVNAEVEILGLIGIYTGRGNDHYINFIFASKIVSGTPSANKDHVNDIGWYTADEIEKIPEDQILNPKKLRKVIAAHQQGRLSSLDCIEEMIYPN